MHIVALIGKATLSLAQSCTYLRPVMIKLGEFKFVTFVCLFFIRPRGGAVSLHPEEAASAGVFPGQSQRVPTD